MFREKKTLSLGCKRYKKRKNSSPCALLFESRGEKRAKVVFIAHTPGRRQLARAQHRATLLFIIPVVCFRHFYACVHVCCANCFKETFLFLFLTFFLQKIVKNSSSCDERKNEQSFPRPTESSQKQQKAKRCLSSLLTPVTKTACALDKAFAATIEGQQSWGESSQCSHSSRSSFASSSGKFKFWNDVLSGESGANTELGERFRR